MQVAALRSSKRRGASAQRRLLAPLALIGTVLIVAFRRHPAWTLRWTVARQGLPAPSDSDVAFMEKEIAHAFDVEEYFRAQRIEVDKALQDSLSTAPLSSSKLIDAMKYSLLAGGKRIRPIVCLAAYDMVAGDTVSDAREVAMPAAVAIEMIHTMSLIHDDLPSMDNDSLRRGMPTNHIKFGESIAILAGDALLSEAFSHIIRSTPEYVPPSRVIDVIKRLSDSVGPLGLTGGQVHDLECEAKDCVSLEELQWIHEHKTAALLEVAAAAGAILAGGSQAEVAACQRYGRSIGIAFQVADDILDVTQTSDDLGKTAGKDEVVNKATYVKLLGLEGAKEEALRLRAEAINALKPFGPRAAPLIGIAEYVVKRTS